jgi:hypothetical protein
MNRPAGSINLGGRSWPFGDIPMMSAMRAILLQNTVAFSSWARPSVFAAPLSPSRELGANG